MEAERIEPVEKKFPQYDYYDLVAVDMKASREEITAGIMEQLKTVGFLLLSNIEGFNEQELFSYCKWISHIPEEEKRKLYRNYFANENPNHYRGMAPFLHNDPSHKEMLDMGYDYDLISPEEQRYALYERTPWPEGEEGKAFRTYMERYYKLMHRLGMKIMEHIAEGLGKPTNFFDKWFEKDTLSTLRTIHYLPRSSEVVKSDKLSEEELKFTTPIHTDSGFLTLLSVFNYPGLQVNVNGEYKTVRPRPEAIVVNLGDMISRITNNTLKATLHRVLDIGVDRYSCPFFFEPHYSARIPNDLMNEQTDSEQVFVYGDFLVEKIRQFGEYKHFQAVKKSQ